MRFNVFLLSIFFAFVSLASNAQSTQNNSIKKGYYTIGRNSEKLNCVARPQRLWAYFSDSMAKGYYSMKSNKSIPQWRYTIDTTGAVREAIKKGYYSI